MRGLKHKMPKILYYGQRITINTKRYMGKIHGQRALHPLDPESHIEGYDDFEEVKRHLKTGGYDILAVNMHMKEPERLLVFARMETNIALVALAMPDTSELGAACDSMGPMEQGRMKKVISRSSAERKNLGELCKL